MDVSELRNLKIKQLIANFLIPLLAVVVSLGLLGFYVYPSLNEVPRLQKELESQESLATQLSDKIKKLNGLSDFKQNVDESNHLVSRALASEPEVPQLLTQVDQIARESGLAITRMSYAINDTGSDGTTPTYPVVAVNVGTLGSYSQIVSFLSNLENASRVVSVTNLRYSLDSEDNLISATFVIISPYVDVSAQATIDEPITFDVADANFQRMMGMLRNLRHYEISVENYININTLPGAEESEESTPSALIEETPPAEDAFAEDTIIEEDPFIEELPIETQ